MTNVEEDAKEEKYPHLRLMQGGKGPPDAPLINNWLSKLQKNAVFSCKDRQNNGMVNIYILVFKHPKTYVLADALGNGPRIAVDEDWCKRFSLLELIEEGGEHPEGVTDGSDRTVRSPDLAHDVDAEAGQPRDGEA